MENLEKELIKNVLENVKICQKFYMRIYDFPAESFEEYILSNLLYIIESIIKELCLLWEDQKKFLSSNTLF